MWRPKLIGSTDQFGGLQCILVDQKTDAIQASVKEIDYDFVAPKIKAGSIYEITHFHTGRNKPSHKIVPHVAQLFFNARTTFKELPTIQPHIPRHRFYLVDYTQLSTRIDKIDILRDVFGHITAIQPLEQKMVGNERLEDKCEVCIENIRFKVSLVLEDSTDETNAIIIGRPAEQLFKISCNELVVQRGFTDQQQLPDVILQTRGQVKIFQLRFGSMRSDFNRNDLLIQAIFDDTMPLIEPTPQSSDKSLAAHDTENIGAQMVPPLPHFSQSKFQVHLPQAQLMLL
ncbi:uncharacterized protein LOC117613766 isoform X1 [Prunus dulcis]|uniref:uncharacterized protein LOC117613766 isoform X1 n=1 Tax=Prunus dulcis TaxID=3755 RepID=UPI0014823DB9|nr:uncharacterized protein LOC117613766 isoform X1 [Prunus dulcis]